jgi:hypothetical protein
VDSDCARKPSQHSHGGVGARSIEQAAVPSLAQAAIFTSRRTELPAKKPLARVISCDIVVDFCFENGKMKGWHVPWVAPERRAFLHRCRSACRLAFGKVAMNKNMATRKFMNS